MRIIFLIWNPTGAEKRRTANSIQPYGDKIYVGYDEGLFCYEGKNQVTDNLVEACGGARIRQIYLDRENNLWVSTFEDGIKEMTQDGKIVSYNTENSGLGTEDPMHLGKQ